MNVTAKIKSTLRRKGSYAINDMRSLLGMNNKLFNQTPGAAIVIYHGICQADHTRFNSIFIRLKTFEAHLQFYKKHFHLLSLDDYYNERFSKDRFSVCLTFDDGFANNYKYVLPLLNQYQAPVTFFITGARDAGYDILWNDFLAIAQKYGPGKFEFLNDTFYKDKYRRYVSKTGSRLLRDLLLEEGFDRKAEMMNCLGPMLFFKNNTHEEDYWLQMTREEIKNLSASPLVKIGCHGYYHNDLSKIPVADVRDEMIRSKQFLEKVTGKEISAIAFPYGAYSREVITQAKAAGFNQLLATGFLFAEDYVDATMRQRLTINPYISVNNQMIATIRGKYE